MINMFNRRELILVIKNNKFILYYIAIMSIMILKNFRVLTAGLHGGSITSTYEREHTYMKRIFSDSYAYAYVYGLYFFEEKK